MTTIGRALLRWLPRPAVVALVLIGVAVGVALVVRPFRSLALLALLVAAGFVLTGAAAIADADREDRLARGVGLAWAVVGVLAVAWPWPTARRLAVILAVALVVAGVLRVAAALRSDRPTSSRISALLQGATLVVAGILAWTWPDLTVLAIALGGGAAAVAVVGTGLLWLLWHGPEHDRPRRGPTPAWRLAASALLLVGALAAAAVSVVITQPDGELDDFYARPDDVPAEPGTLLRAEPFESSIPDGATAWRILYTTVGAHDAPAIASGVVVVPDAVGSTDPPPVVAWAHGTTGAARHCAPSAMPDPWTPGAFLLDEVLDEGWSLVATDYVGLGAEGEPHPYLVGEPAARSVLDAVRAARQLDQVALGDQTVVWGHSQGGGAALWTGQVAPSYASDVPLSGVAALAPASDLPGLMDALEVVSGGSIFAGYAVEGFAAAYDDVAVTDVVRPVGRVTVDEAGDRCLDASALASIVSSLVVGMDVFVADPTAGALGERMAENVPLGPIEAPLLVAQGADDSLVLASMQQGYVAALCDSGQAVEYREYEGRDHVPLVEADSPLVPDLLDWTRARFAGAPTVSTCGTSEAG